MNYLPKENTMSDITERTNAQRIKELDAVSRRHEQRLTRLSRMMNESIEEVGRLNEVNNALTVRIRKLELESMELRNHLDKDVDAVILEVTPEPPETRSEEGRETLIAEAIANCPNLPIRLDPGEWMLRDDEVKALIHFHHVQQVYNKNQLMKEIYGVSSGYSAYSKKDKLTQETLSQRFERVNAEIAKCRRVPSTPGMKLSDFHWSA